MAEVMWSLLGVRRRLVKLAISEAGEGLGGGYECLGVTRSCSLLTMYEYSPLGGGCECLGVTRVPRSSCIGTGVATPQFLWGGICFFGGGPAARCEGVR